MALARALLAVASRSGPQDLSLLASTAARGLVSSTKTAVNGIPVEVRGPVCTHTKQINRWGFPTTYLHPAVPKVYNESGSKRVVVTKELPGDRWLQILQQAGCRVEVSKHQDIILSNSIIKQLIGKQCDGVIGQLTEVNSTSLRRCARTA
jgi:hypothetical protein